MQAEIHRASDEWSPVFVQQLRFQNVIIKICLWVIRLNCHTLGI